ncbi:MAG TPA: hypothetical protein VJ651_16140, partial [Noviherbaspirillum sp.]
MRWKHARAHRLLITCPSACHGVPRAIRGAIDGHVQIRCDRIDDHFRYALQAQTDLATFVDPATRAVFVDQTHANIVQIWEKSRQREIQATPRVPMQRGGQFKALGADIKLHGTPPFKTNELSLTSRTNKENLINTYIASVFSELLIGSLIEGGQALFFDCNA